MTQTTTLYRPMGLKELKLIFDSAYKAFPPRLYWQPIFYPVTNFPYAEQITREWNVVSNGDHCGFVTAFDVDTDYLKKFDIQNVGGEMHNELWVPAEELEEFNAKIAGDIRIVASRYEKAYTGVPVESGELANKNIREQLAHIAALAQDVPKLKQVLASNEFTVLTNLGFWNKYHRAEYPILETIIQVWSDYRPQQASCMT